MMSLSGNVTHICVDIHDFQSRRRIEEIVCRDIDHVLDELDDPRALAAFASDPSKSPEARTPGRAAGLEARDRRVTAPLEIDLARLKVDESVASRRKPSCYPLYLPIRLHATLGYHTEVQWARLNQSQLVPIWGWVL